MSAAWNILLKKIQNAKEYYATVEIWKAVLTWNEHLTFLQHSKNEKGDSFFLSTKCSLSFKTKLNIRLILEWYFFIFTASIKL